jgi:endonuclease YncB( thermonuclease family)
MHAKPRSGPGAGRMSASGTDVTRSEASSRQGSPNRHPVESFTDPTDQEPTLTPPFRQGPGLRWSDGEARYGPRPGASAGLYPQAPKRPVIVAEILQKTSPAACRSQAPPRLHLAVAALAAVIGVAIPAPAPAGDTTGGGQNLQVIDGDTLQSGADIIQLYGIDAPELGQICIRKDQPWQCGVEAALALQKLVSLSGTPLVCQAWNELKQTQGPNGELIRVCLVGPNQDLAQAMLRNGYVMALPGSFPYYGQLEREARKAGLGIWGSDVAVVPPWEWRQGKRLQAEAEPSAQACNVKGKVSAAGERIYVVPTDADYKNAAAADRFCSDEAARQAGWRRAGETDGTSAR